MQHLLTLIVFLPAIGALLLGFVPKDRHRTLEWGGLIVSLLTLVLSVVLLTQFNDVEDDRFQFVTAARWIPQLGIQYKTGVDGIAITLLVLTTLLSAVAIL